MMNRRNIRSKVMQELYSLDRSGDTDLEQSVKRLYANFENIYKLYFLLFDLLASIRDMEADLIERRKKKFIKTDEDLHPDTRLVNNRVLRFLSENQFLKDQLRKYKIDKIWPNEPELVRYLLDKIKASEFYMKYKSIPEPSFEDDKEFVMDIFKNIIAPDEKLRAFLENWEMNWADDAAIANTMVLKTLSRLTEDMNPERAFGPLFKNDDDRDFGRELLLRTFNNREKLAELIKDKTINWDFDRLSQVDKILMMMGAAEFLYFPTIPPTVSINEYVEIAKEFSTPKSNKFINGILDRIYKDLQAENKLNKIVNPKNE
ncbi:MAG: transcription antitermination factor NusB [Chlorobi bacterium]|nr:transcription antitermination factor NusB [Chlorobiota bacterium]